MTTKTKTPYAQMVARIAGQYEPGHSVSADDLKPLSDADLATVINDDPDYGYADYWLDAFVEVKTSVIYASEVERGLALLRAQTVGADRAARIRIASDVNSLLYWRSEPAVDPMARAMDDAGMRERDFA